MGSKARRMTFSHAVSRPEEVNWMLFRLFAWSVAGVVVSFVSVCMYGVLGDH